MIADPHALIDEVFAGIGQGNPTDFPSRVILCPKNKSTLLVNEEILERLPGECTQYASVDEALTEETEEAAKLPTGISAQLDPIRDASSPAQPKNRRCRHAFAESEHPARTMQRNATCH